VNLSAERLPVRRSPPSFAIAVPQQIGPHGFDPAAVRAYLQRAESLPFDSCWVSEQVVGTAPLLAPLELLAMAAGCTQRLRLGTAAVISTVRSPLHLAHSVATLDHLSGGRVELGVAGGGPRRPFAAYGATAEGYPRRFLEGVELVKAAWQQPEVTFHGRCYQVDRLPVEPKPVQRPHPPLWVGGSHPAAVRRAVRLADGFFGAGSTSTAAFAGQVDVVRAALREAGRDADGFRIAKRVYVAVDDDAQRARARIGSALDTLYSWFGLRDLDAVAVAGTPADCAAGLRDVADAGARLLLLDPLDGAPEQLERLAAEVLPAVTG
jgi:probable F420-dependent oxidoreductase